MQQAVARMKFLATRVTAANVRVKNQPWHVSCVHLYHSSEEILLFFSFDRRYPANDDDDQNHACAHVMYRRLPVYGQFPQPLLEMGREAAKLNQQRTNFEP